MTQCPTPSFHPPMQPAIFLDRDGVICENRPDHVKAWDEFAFLPGVLDALRMLAETNTTVVVVTNQAIINRGLVSRDTVDEINRRMVIEVQQQGGRVDAVLYCPHRPDERCLCRKPQPGLLMQAAEQFNADLRQSFLVGDARSDIEAALAVGSKPILVLTGRGKEQWRLLQECRVNGYRTAADLLDAVRWIQMQDLPKRVARSR